LIRRTIILVRGVLGAVRLTSPLSGSTAGHAGLPGTCALRWMATGLPVQAGCNSVLSPDVGLMLMRGGDKDVECSGSALLDSGPCLETALPYACLIMLNAMVFLLDGWEALISGATFVGADPELFRGPCRGIWERPESRHAC